jgi:hypothetical protein
LPLTNAWPFSHWHSNPRTSVPKLRRRWQLQHATCM